MLAPRHIIFSMVGLLLACVEPVRLSRNIQVDALVPDGSFLTDAELDFDAQLDLGPAPLLDGFVDVAVDAEFVGDADRAEPPNCGNGELEAGEECDDANEQCVECRLVQTNGCEQICDTGGTRAWVGLSYVESISDLTVEGNTQFGSAIAVDGRRAVIGAPGTNIDDDSAAEGTGQVYFVEFEEGRVNRNYNDSNGFLAVWPQVGGTLGQFGAQIAMEGRVAFVSARFHENDGGSLGRIYGYYRRDNGLWRALDGLAIESDQSLGTGLALDNFALVFNVSGLNGDHFVQSYGTIIEDELLLLPNQGDRPEFDGVLGERIALKDRWMLVNVEVETMDPRVVVYEKQLARFGSIRGWERRRAYRPTGATQPSSYGFSMDSHGDFSVFGAPTDAHDGIRCGAVYIIHESAQSQRIAPEDCAEGARFGHSVAMDGNRLLIGSPGYADGSGQVFLFRRDDRTWVQDGAPVADPNGEGTRFGTSLGLGSGFTLIGAPREPGLVGEGVGRGRVHVYHYDAPLCFSDDGSCLCQAGWGGKDCACRLETRGERTYLFCSQPSSWEAARSACQANTMDLVVVEDAEENDWLTQITRSRFDGSAWLGLQDIEVNGTFVWVDGTPLSYSDWREDEPDNAIDERQNCVGFDARGWADFRCSREEPFVCEEVHSAETPP